MFFSRALFSLFAVGAISVLAAPSPAPVEKREDISDVLAVLDSFDAKTTSLTSQIDFLVDNDQATEENLSPLLEDLVLNTDQTTAALKSLEGKVDANNGGSKQDVANRAAASSEKIIRTSHNIKTKKPHLHFLIIKYGLELALWKLLTGLGLVVAGVLVLVAVLLKAVGGLLIGLGWVLLPILFGFKL